MFEAWRNANRPVEAHFYESGGHGFASATKGTTSDLWFTECLAWMKARRLLDTTPIAYSATTPIGVLLEDPTAKAVLEKDLPASLLGELNGVRSMSVKSLNKYLPANVTDQMVSDVDRDLVKLNASK